MSSADELVPTMPCILVTRATLLTAAPGRQSPLWLDNLSLQISQASVVSSIDAASQDGSSPALVSLEEAKLYMTNVDIAGAGSESAALRLRASQALVTGTLPSSAYVHAAPYLCDVLPSMRVLHMRCRSACPSRATQSRFTTPCLSSHHLDASSTCWVVHLADGAISGFDEPAMQLLQSTVRLEQTSFDPLSAAAAAVQLRGASGAALQDTGYIEHTRKPVADADEQSGVFSSKAVQVQRRRKTLRSAHLQSASSFGRAFLADSDKDFRAVVQVWNSFDGS